ncbi:MAG: type II toxin-antitoxin system RelE/ParE family toxin [Rhizonema sp. PD38]|nr:type II toxin-antitoxin system RelE/ParE family toxin [Rhizonema sp. PD38]
MNYRLIVKDRATQDLRQQANYILVNGNADAAEATFTQLAKTPSMGKVTQLAVLKLGEVRQWRIKNFKDYLIFYRIQDATVDIRESISWSQRFGRCTH